MCRPSRTTSPIRPVYMSTTREDLSQSIAANEPETPRVVADTWHRRPDAPYKLRHMLSLEDFEAEAKKYLPRPIFGYISGGSETNAAMRGNREAFNELSFMPRVLVSTRGRNQKTTLLGQTYDLPFGMAPMGGTSLAAYEGDTVFARTAAELNMPMIQSGASLTTLERVKEVGRTAWFQAYLPGDSAFITKLVERVARGGFDTLVLTADVPVMANRENNVRNGYSSPLKPTPRLMWDCAIRPRWFFGTWLRTIANRGMPHLENMGFDRIPIMSMSMERPRVPRDALAWEHLEHMRKIWKGKLIVKGVLAASDVRICRESGCDGVIISNHGGRQLDGTVAPLRALPGAVAEAGNMAVMMDSGVRRGTDVLKALALGAHFVFVGRPFLYAASIAGADGLRHAVKLLRDEIDRNMAMLGINSPKQITRDFLCASKGLIQ